MHSYIWPQEGSKKAQQTTNQIPTVFRIFMASVVYPWQSYSYLALAMPVYIINCMRMLMFMGSVGRRGLTYHTTVLDDYDVRDDLCLTMESYI